MKTKNKSVTKAAFAFSVCLMILWGLLGTGTTLAWFVDTTEPVKNTFYVGELDVKVTYKDGNDYFELTSTTNVFDDSALYEPGYVQVVLLQIENMGDIAFDYTAAVTVNDYTTAVNVYGQRFNLVPHLNYGVVFADTEAEVIEKVDSRLEAYAIASTPLSAYTSDVDTLEINESKFMALVVSMPTDVGNEANYRGNDIPTVKLGINVKASQEGTMK